jgi:penicillin-binding protein 1C
MRESQISVSLRKLPARVVQSVVRPLGLALTCTGVLALIGCLSILFPLPRADFRAETVHSLRVLDRRGVLLREFQNDLEGRGEWVPLARISHNLLKATVAAEDRRFYKHIGLDPVALGRAIVDNLRAGEFVSGGSTITQQVIRNIYHHHRTLFSKMIEAWYALRLERMMTKGEILEQYLNRVPYGNQLFGAEAASRTYVGKPARDLSIAEAAFLAALPNAPTTFNPYRGLEHALARQRSILAKMLAQEMITADEYDRAVHQVLQVSPREISFRAPHAVEMVAREIGERSGAASVRTTLDDALQQNVEWIVKKHLTSLQGKNVTNAAVVVIDNASAEIRVLLGSADYFDELHSGQVNGALALRQPGSSIKPFTYGLALEAGWSPSDIIADLPVHIPDDRGDYIPENYDRRYHGPVSLRVALACSYNIPAVRLCQDVGKHPLLQCLQCAGITSLTHPAEYYGYGLTLGNGEVSLLELTNAYAAIAAGGTWRPSRLIDAVSSPDGRDLSASFRLKLPSHTVFDERTAFLLTQMLSDPVARRPAFGGAFQFPFTCAVKTGTTKDYRDNWTVGYTTAYTVGVWVGNFDGSPMRGVSGVTGAGQIFTDVVMLLHSPPFGRYPGDFGMPSGLVQQRICPRSGKLPTRECERSILEWFAVGTVPQDSCAVHQRYRVRDESGMEREVVFEIYPPEYSEWSRQERIPRPSEGAIRVQRNRPVVADPVTREPFRLAITMPNDGDLFKIDPLLRQKYQKIKVVGLVPKGLKRVTVRIDEGREVDYRESGVWWQLERGTHRFVLSGMAGSVRIASQPIRISVE